MICYGRENIYKLILRDKDKLLKFIEIKIDFEERVELQIIKEAKDENTFSAS